MRKPRHVSKARNLHNEKPKVQKVLPSWLPAAIIDLNVNVIGQIVATILLGIIAVRCVNLRGYVNGTFDLEASPEDAAKADNASETSFVSARDSERDDWRSDYLTVEPDHRYMIRVDVVEGDDVTVRVDLDKDHGYENRLLAWLDDR